MPHVEPGMAVGLFGGSFNPPHEGHVLVADTAIRKLRLDQLWWIVTPGNPLKDNSNLARLSTRIEWSREIATDPRIKFTAFETAHNLRYTAQTLRFVKQRNHGVKFVWVMGADNLAGFHHWQDWQFIANAMPIAIVDRPGSTLSYLSSIMAKTFGHARVDENDVAALARMKPPAWTFIHGPRSPHSSTAIRKTQEKQSTNDPPTDRN
ncbi:nicotinate-nucleotide adenylyltransferase [Hoeflea sp. TYP-13]|uniref:nicotinate-nucleotide adenylyltransferase n=1 Tax=Hoeflea sp. TYP-13 TaxID=3230023 RepID=UPI0034C606A3